MPSLPSGSDAPSRIGTARPATARPQTAATSRAEGSYVIAIMESRGVNREIGVAALDRDTGRVSLMQLADCQTYVKTLHHIELHYPQTVLVPDTSLSASSNKSLPSLLMPYLREEFPGIRIEPVLRKYWNETVGLEFVNQLCIEDEERAATLVACANKYYMLSAACALFKHAEAKLNVRYSARSLMIRYTPVEGTMFIDPETARNLELTANMTQKKSTHSLFGLLNYTHTPMAARLLRMNILAPITVQSSIDSRLEAVDEIVHSEDLFAGIRDALKGQASIDLDKLIAALIASEAREISAAKTASIRVAQMLNLKQFLSTIPQLRKSLEMAEASILRIIAKMLFDERLGRLETMILSSLNPEVGSAKGGGLSGLNSRVYAVKANHNRLLDVARETYKENVGDILQLTETLCEEHGLPIQAVYQDTGFVLSLRKTDLEGAFPKGFINITTRGQKWFFSSVELKKRNARLKDALEETLLLSAKTINNLVSEVVVDVGALYMASEAIALLDMIWAFSHCAIRRSYVLYGALEFTSKDARSKELQAFLVRPEFTGTLAIKAGRHPILERVQPPGTLVANDVYCSETSSFQLVQGANMSGKSTYLRQIALLTIMALCGSFVPAEYASFRIHDALLTRLSNDDDIEKSLSTFSSEMASSAMILGLATSDSLVLIDELGRGTSPGDGIGICHAVAECLIGVKAFTFFATHFGDLTTTLSRHPSVVQLHLLVHKNRPSSTGFGLTFGYKILDGGPDRIDHYGLELARLADLPTDVIAEAGRVSHKLAALEEARRTQSKANQIILRRKALLRMRTQLRQAAQHSKLSEEDFAQYLMVMQQDLVEVLGGGLSNARGQLG